MKNILKNSKRKIVASLLILCLLLSISGTCVYAVSVKQGGTNEVANVEEELVPMMAQGCENDYSYYDGCFFDDIADGLDTIGIDYTGSGLSTILTNTQWEIKTGQFGTNFCVFIEDKTTGTELCWFKVSRW